MTATTAAHGDLAADAAADDRLGRRGWGEAIGIGAAQILALLPGFSRSGATIAAGLVRGLDHEDAARFAFLLATPVILAAGLLKLASSPAPRATASWVRSPPAAWSPGSGPTFPFGS